MTTGFPMFDLFTSGVPYRIGVTLPSNNRNVAREINTLIDRVYHRQMELSPIVPNDHFLVRLLKALPRPLVDDPHSVYFTGEDLANQYDQMFNILSTNNGTAKLQVGGILSKASPELYLDYRHTLKPGDLSTRLLNMHAVTVIRHPYTSLSFRGIDGEYNVSPALCDYVIMGIDLPLLYTQFHIWQKQRIGAMRQASEEAEFVYRYVLCRLIKRCTMLSMGNQYHVSLHGLRTQDAQYRGLVNTQLGRDHFSEIVDQQLTLMGRKPTDAYEFLSHLPVLGFDLYQINRLRLIHETPSTRLVYALALCDVIQSIQTRPNRTGENKLGWLNDWRQCYRHVMGNLGSSKPVNDAMAYRLEYIYSLLK